MASKKRTPTLAELRREARRKGVNARLAWTASEARIVIETEVPRGARKRGAIFKRALFAALQSMPDYDTAKGAG